MASHKIPTLSFVELIFLAKHAIGLAARTVLGFPRFIPYVLNGSWSLKMAVGVSFVRADAYSLREKHYLSPTTGQVMEKYCKTNSFPLKSFTLAGSASVPDATLHIFDMSEGKTGDGKLLLYLHGGGYVYPIMGDADLGFQVECARATGAHRLAVLEYTLAPELKYPGQLAQAAAALQHLLDEEKLRPDQIILTGSSAGGNLAMAVLAHMQKPHPDVPALTGISNGPGKQLRGVMLLSPWVGTAYSKPSYFENEKYDFIAGHEMRWLNDTWGAKSEFWADPMTAPASYWNGLPVKDMLLTAGTWEIFRDDIYHLYEELKAGGVNVSLAKGEAEVHVQSALDTALNLRPSVTTVKALEWMANQ